MTDFLVRCFVKDHEEIKKVSVRTAYGILASIVGIVCNVFLFVVKGTIGFAMNSIAVMADAFNNLSDAASSIIGLVGVKMAEKPADEKHPFGHGRMEYIAALIVSFLVLEVGFTFFKDALDKIRHPQILDFQTISMVILILSIGVKLWLGLFNRKLGKRIDSKVMLATATDALGDVITTSATIISILVYQFLHVNIDGIVGLGVALVVMWAGVGIAKNTLDPLIGKAVDPEEYRRIKTFVEKYEGVVGSHDLILHDYGPGRSMASIHTEVPNDMTLEISHEIVDKIEHDAMEELGLCLVIHMDPIETKDPEVLKMREIVENYVEKLDDAVSIHDFRMVKGKIRKNIVFDMVVPHEYTQEKREDLKEKVIRKVKECDQKYECIITMEEGFIAKSTETVV